MDFTLGLLGSLTLLSGINQSWPYNLGAGYKNECSREIVVGVVDTGLTDQLREVRRSVKVNRREIIDGKDNDSNGYVDDVAGWDFGYQDRRPEDTNGHGTHVTQILLGNALPVLPGELKCRPKIRVVPIKYYNTRWANVWDSNQSLQYALNYPGMALVNYSSGGRDPSQPEKDIIERMGQAGIVVVVVAGNDAEILTETPYYPASYGLSNVVAVANCIKPGIMHPSSSRGGDTKFCALGSNVRARTHLNRVEALSGTSQAAPHVTRAIAALMSIYPALTPKQAVDKLCVTATPLQGTTCGYLNLEKALGK